MKPTDLIILKSELARLKAERGNWEQTWQEIIDYVMINRAPVIGKVTPGEKRTRLVYDNTATNAHATLSAVIESMMASPSSPWLALETTSDELNKDKSAKEYCAALIKTVLREMENSNFYTANSESVRDLTGFGSACMSIMPSKKIGKTLNYQARHIKECYFVENSEGVVDTLYRVVEMTAYQISDQFTKKVDKVEKSMESGNSQEMFPVVHVIRPNKEARPGKKKSSRRMAFEGVWFLEDEDDFLEISFFETFPFVTPRWGKDSSEVYGRSPAINNLADIKTLNQMEKTLLRTAQKAADPPFQLPDDGFIGGVKLTPGGANYYRAGTSDRIEPIETGANFSVTFEMQNDRRQRINTGFLTSQLQLISEREMTAEEVRQRTVENARILGPVFTRLVSEYLDAMVIRTIEVLKLQTDPQGNPILPKEPEMLRGVQYRLKYISPLSKQQRMVDVQAIDQTVATAASWAEIRPDVVDNIDLDKAISIVADLNGTPSEVLRSTAERNQVRKQIAAQASKTQEAELAKVGADMAKTRAETAQIAGVPGAAAAYASPNAQPGPYQ